MVEKIFPAKDTELDNVIGFIEENLEKAGCPLKIQMSIEVAIEEIFVNVAHYAYNGEDGDAKVSFEFNPGTRTATFIIADRGIPFNPLKKEDPDITLSADEREIGGLGIFITKKTMDSIHYSYENNENILTMTKII